MTNQNEAKNCPKRDNNVESETELIITEVNELNKVKRPVGRPRKHFDPNHKYERKNKYFFCDVCNKTCEYYHQKKHFKTKYHLQRLKEQGQVVEEVDECIEVNNSDSEPEPEPELKPELDDEMENILNNLFEFLYLPNRKDMLRCKNHIYQKIDEYYQHMNFDSC